MGFNEACVLVHVASGPGGVRELDDIAYFADHIAQFALEQPWENGKPDFHSWRSLSFEWMDTGTPRTPQLLRKVLEGVQQPVALREALRRAPELTAGGPLFEAMVTLPALTPGRRVSRSRSHAHQGLVNEALGVLHQPFCWLDEAEFERAEANLLACVVGRQPRWLCLRSSDPEFPRFLEAWKSSSRPAAIAQVARVDDVAGQLHAVLLQSAVPVALVRTGLGLSHATLEPTPDSQVSRVGASIAWGAPLTSA